MPVSAAGHDCERERALPAAISASIIFAISGLSSCDNISQRTLVVKGSDSMGFVVADEMPAQQGQAQPAKRQRLQPPRPALPRTRRSTARRQGSSITGSDSEDFPLRHRSSLRKQPGRAAGTPNAGRLPHARQQRLHKLHHAAAGPADAQAGGSGSDKAADLQRDSAVGSSSDELPDALPRSQARRRQPQVVPDEEDAPGAPKHRTQRQSLRAAAAPPAALEAASDDKPKGRSPQAGAVSSSGFEAASDAEVAPKRQAKRRPVQATVVSTSGSDDERLQPAQPRSAARSRTQVVADDDQSDADPPHAAEAAAGQQPFVSTMPVSPEPSAQHDCPPSVAWSVETCSATPHISQLWCLHLLL